MQEPSIKDKWSIVETTDVPDLSGPSSGTRRMMQKFAMAQDHKNYMLQLPSTIYEQMHGASSNRLDSLVGGGKLQLKHPRNHRATQSLVSSTKGSPHHSILHETRHAQEDVAEDLLASTYTNSLVRIAKSREQKLSERDVEKIKYMFLGTANTLSPVEQDTAEKPLLQDRLTRKLAYKPHNLFGPKHHTSSELHSISQELRHTKGINSTIAASAEPSPNASTILPGARINKGKQLLDPIMCTLGLPAQESIFSTEPGLMTAHNQSAATTQNQSTLNRQRSRNYYGKKIDYKNELQFLLAGKNKSRLEVNSRGIAGVRHPLAGGQSFDSVDGEINDHEQIQQKVVLSRQPSIPLSPTRRIVTSSNWVLHKSKYPYSVYANRLPRRLKIQVQDFNDFYAPAIRTGNRVWRVSVFALLAIRRMNNLVKLRQEKLANIERLKKLAKEKEEAEKSRIMELERKRLAALYQKELELRRLDLASIAANEEPTVPFSNQRHAEERGADVETHPVRLLSPAGSNAQPADGLSGALSAALRPRSPPTVQRQLSEQPNMWKPRTFDFPKVQLDSGSQPKQQVEDASRTPSISGLPVVLPGQAFTRITDPERSSDPNPSKERNSTVQIVPPGAKHIGDFGSKNIANQQSGIVDRAQGLEIPNKGKAPLPKLAGLVGSSAMYYFQPEGNRGSDSNESKNWRSEHSNQKDNQEGSGQDHTGKLLASSGLGISRTWDILDIGHDARISQARDTTLADDKYNSPWLDIVDELLDATSLHAVYEVGYYSFFGIDELKDLKQIDYEGDDDNEKNAVRAFWKLYAKVSIDCEMDEYLLDGLHWISEEYEQNFAFNSHAYYTPQDLNPKFFIKLYAPHFGIEMKNKVPEQLKKLANIARYKLNDRKPRLLPGEGTEASSQQDII